MKKVYIIGAGIGGLSIAARLLQYGFEVEIFEKNNTIGGKTNFIQYKDFKFDLTASIMMFPQNYIDLFLFCREDYRDYFTTIPVNNLYNVFYSDNSRYTFNTNLTKLTKTISEITDGNIKDNYGYFEFLSNNYKKYLLAEDSILNKSLLKTSSLLNSLSLPKVINLNTFASSYDDAKKYIKNKKLLDYLMFQTMYVGISPYASPSIYNIIPTVTQYHGLYHIRGGMYSYITALEKLVIKKGGIIHKSSPVHKILFKNNKANGIVVNGQNHYSDVVVCSSDYSYTIKSLIKDSNVKNLIKPINNLEYSCSTFILYLGLDKKYPNLNLHNIYINNELKENLKLTFDGFLPNDISMYIYCPSSLDDTICPKNGEAINVMVRVPNTLTNKVNWNYETIYYFTKKTLKTLRSIKGLEDILDHIVYINHLTPLDFKNKFNTYGGCAFGLSHTLKQSAIFRPQCQIPKIKNLFFTGASIHPGNGVAMVLKSSKICASKINKMYMHNT